MTFQEQLQDLATAFKPLRKNASFMSCLAAASEQDKFVEAITTLTLDSLPAKRDGGEFRELFDTDSPYVLGYNDAIEAMRTKLRGDKE